VIFYDHIPLNLVLKFCSVAV